MKKFSKVGGSWPFLNLYRKIKTAFLYMSGRRKSFSLMKEGLVVSLLLVLVIILTAYFWVLKTGQRVDCGALPHTMQQ